MSARIGLFDYGSGNLHSAARAFANAGADVVVTSDLAELGRRDALVVPGVGAFAACMSGLRAAGGVELIRDWVAAERPLFGICVGHQVLFAGGTEHGTHADGVGLFPGTVGELPARRLPHMGWNTVQAPAGSRLFAGLEGERFYFVHSYAAAEGPEDGVVSTARHEDATFVAAVERGPVSSTQFHPEKSGAAGARLIANWLSALSDRV
ncbi:MAG: imidazole glycerol phosphate synthase subunit HisH [Arachnia sp.]